MKITVSTKLPNFHFIVRELLMGVAVGNMIAPFVNKEFHMQRKRLKTIHNPWLTKGLLKYIRKKAKLYKKFFKNPDIYNEKV